MTESAVAAAAVAAAAVAATAVAAVAATSGDKSCGVESQRADATQGSSVVNDTPNYLHIGEFVERKK